MSPQLALALGFSFACGFVGGIIFCRLLLWEANRIMKKANYHVAEANRLYDQAISFYKEGANLFAKHYGINTEGS